MSYRYGKNSRKQLNTLYPLLQTILLKVLTTDDHSVDQGGRTDEEQWAFYNKGTSKLHPPDGKHLLKQDPTNPSDTSLYAFAADVTPWINNKRLATHGDAFGIQQAAQFAWFLRKVYETSREILPCTGWCLRMGINWDGDAEILTDQSWDDWFHIELERDE